jgi:signal transduction histidine kinase
MKGRHETLGVLYLDTHRTAREMAAQPETSPFTEDHLALASAIAHQAALAIEETRYHQAMVQAERLAAIGQTIAALSHHIKNILQGLRSGNDLLKMGITQKNESLLQQGWKISEKSQARIYDLVMDMLSFSKDREPAVEPVDLNEVAHDVADLVQGRAKDLQIQLTLKLADHLPIVQVDSEAIHRALLNIVSNAFDAVEGLAKPQVTIVSRSESTKGWVFLEVGDNGPGIPPEKMAEIFKPFVSTKGAKGTGLGLAVSRKILLEHGGDITVHSEPGQDCTFSLGIPLKNPMSSEGSSQDMPIYQPPQNDSKPINK